MKFHSVCGLPRSGSTLLCNILNQNPKFQASSTSCIAQSVLALSKVWSSAPEVKSDLIHDKDATDARMLRASKSMVEAWYQDSEADVIFDKGRLWNSQPLVLRHLFPEAHMFVCVRDLRDVFASLEKQHAKNPLLDDAQNPLEKTVFNRADRMFSPQGIIGTNIIGVEDLGRRQLPYVHIIQFEALVNNPKMVLEGIYSDLGEEYFAHDFENVENSATDADAIYNNKFPHEGSGKVQPPEGSWRDYISPDIAGLIMERFPDYNRALNYTR
jgi:sulfotransferase